ncbi:hypothetical protein C7M84_018180 [Penaeus vannamei]|uniref:Uncharacterized protein n=1 Tax=Penaeus vannamei TaxID=6689 RepID=A0A423SI58_PENVA|nr:hypothetical protein C7M84_018180 [Penaeus vannamei]
MNIESEFLLDILVVLESLTLLLRPISSSLPPPISPSFPLLSSPVLLFPLPLSISLTHSSPFPSPLFLFSFDSSPPLSSIPFGSPPTLSFFPFSFPFFPLLFFSYSPLLMHYLRLSPPVHLPLPELFFSFSFPLFSSSLPFLSPLTSYFPLLLLFPNSAHPLLPPSIFLLLFSFSHLSPSSPLTSFSLPFLFFPSSSSFLLTHLPSLPPSLPLHLLSFPLCLSTSSASFFPPRPSHPLSPLSILSPRPFPSVPPSFSSVIPLPSLFPLPLCPSPPLSLCPPTSRPSSLPLSIPSQSLPFPSPLPVPLPSLPCPSSLPSSPCPSSLPLFPSPSPSSPTAPSATPHSSAYIKRNQPRYGALPGFSFVDSHNFRRSRTLPPDAPVAEHRETAGERSGEGEKNKQGEQSDASGLKHLVGKDTAWAAGPYGLRAIFYASWESSASEQATVFLLVTWSCEQEERIVGVSILSTSSLTPFLSQGSNACKGRGCSAR